MVGMFKVMSKDRFSVSGEVRTGAGSVGDLKGVFSLGSALSVLFQRSLATFKEEGLMIDCTIWSISFPRH
jgi:hypothetical protein